MHTLKRFIQYYAPYKAVFFLDLVCAAIISLVDLAFPQILRTLTRTLFVENASSIMRNLVPIGIVLFLIYVLQACCKYYVSYQGHMMGAHMERDMRQQIFDHYEKSSFSYYDQNNSGQMMSKLVSDLFDIAEFAHHGPENLFISLIKIIGSFVFLFLINWKLAIPLLVMVVFMIFFSGSQNRKMQTTFMDNRQKIGNVNSSLQDTLAGIRVVQSFANEEIEREKFMESNHGFLLSKKANYQCMGSFMSGNLFFQGMMYLITLVFGGWLIAHGQMEVADLAMYALYIGIFISPIQILVELTEMMQKGLSGFRRFLDVVETEPEITNAPDAELLDDVKGDVNYENVFFHYSDDDTPVLENVSFHIPAGKSIALVGPAGSGKTTICSLLPRFYDVTGGKAAEDAAKKANIHDFIMELPDGYETFVGERGTRLSGGQKQRISIARVFLKNPPILILDEATSALDNESERWIQQSLEELAKNRTTITIAHRLSTIRNADEILVVADNGIAERGTHDEFIARGGIYAHYYEMS